MYAEILYQAYTVTIVLCVCVCMCVRVCEHVCVYEVTKCKQVRGNSEERRYLT